MYDVVIDKVDTIEAINKYKNIQYVMVCGEDGYHDGVEICS